MLLSTVIVVGIAVLVAAWTNRDLIRIKLASVYARVPAKPGTAALSSTGDAGALRGDAPWALSALPECLTQTLESTGSQAYVRAHLPKGATAIVPPARLVYGNCSITIANGEAIVRRGADRLRIPPRAQFYRLPGALALIRTTGDGAELRVYEPAQP